MISKYIPSFHQIGVAGIEPICQYLQTGNAPLRKFDLPGDRRNWQVQPLSILQLFFLFNNRLFHEVKQHFLILTISQKTWYIWWYLRILQDVKSPISLKSSFPTFDAILNTGITHNENKFRETFTLSDFPSKFFRGYSLIVSVKDSELISLCRRWTKSFLRAVPEKKNWS